MANIDREKLTPMMLQYFAVKDEYPDTILMYRLGDFYEMFFEDAEIASRVLDIALTGRACGLDERAPMCGVPFHKADVYIGRLVEKGYKVAVCEQTEDPAEAKGLVRREVIKIVTPGTVTESTLLSDKKNNFLCAVYVGAAASAVGFADITTGRIYATDCTGAERDARLKNELASYAPSEILMNVAKGSAPALDAFFAERTTALVEYDQSFRFDKPDAAKTVRAQFAEYGVERLSRECVCVVGALLDYIKETQKTDISFIKELNVYSDGQYLEFDINTHRNLEITESMRTKEKKGSLLWVLDRTKTAMGARLLRSWLLHPLLSIPEITRRQSAIRALCDDLPVREELAAALGGVLDLERLMAKISYGSANARDMLGILNSISVLPEVKQRIGDLDAAEFRELAAALDSLDDIRKLLADATPGAVYMESFEAIADYLRANAKTGDLILTMGAGDITKLSAMLLK